MTALAPNDETQFQPCSDECAAQAIRVELSERDPKRGDCTPVAACSIAKVEGTAAPICSLARELLRLGVGANTPLSIWRGKTKCFDDAPISVWARLTVSEGPSGTVFRRYEPFLGLRVASGRAESDV
ncbi:MAG: hypothetical protein IID54_07365 [Proteobacteria bacterium]|nr:hypothetical protein [Pseudomonadota bacterium]